MIEFVILELVVLVISLIMLIRALKILDSSND